MNYPQIPVLEEISQYLLSHLLGEEPNRESEWKRGTGAANPHGLSNMGYSALSAPTGLIRVTRRAGIQDAASATTPRTTGTPTNVSGSSACTP